MYLFIYFVGPGTHVDSEGDLQKLVSSFNCVDLRDLMQVFRLGSKFLYPLIHLTRPPKYIYIKKKGQY